MRLYVLCFLLIVSILTSNAQKPSINTYKLKLKGSVQEVMTYDEASGSPYIYENFLDCNVYLKSNNNNPIEYKMNYNAYKDQMEYKEDEITYAIANPEQILKLEINNQYYIFSDYYNYDLTKRGYFIELVDDYISLYKREIISNISLDNYAYSNSESKKSKFVKERSLYYLSVYGEPLTLIKTKKKLLKLFFNHPKVEEYIKKEKIKLHSEEDLIKLVKFLNDFDKNR